MRIWDRACFLPNGKTLSFSAIFALLRGFWHGLCLTHYKIVIIDSVFPLTICRIVDVLTLLF
jgi:hypothetical protein